MFGRPALAALALTALTLPPGWAAVGETPQYEPVRAKLFQPRDGLGNVLAKLQSGGDVKIAHLGGSITAASGWRIKTREWFAQQFPKARVSEINAAIGGTGSDLGVFRLKHDVLDDGPDLVFVEFSVNDGGASPEQIWQAVDGIVRQTWAANPRTDISFIYTFRVGYEKDLNEGPCPRAASATEMLAEHYGIPSINVALRVVELHPEQPDRRPVAFRLKDPDTELKAPKYQGTKLRVSQVLLLGDLVDSEPGR